MPRLPAVALHEMKARGVAREPAVGASRAEIELGAEAVQRLTGRRDSLRVGVTREQLGLLGVGPKAAVDDQVDAVRRRRGRHSVKRQRNVRTQSD